MVLIRVRLKERSYPVFIGKGLLSDAGRLLKKAGVRHRHALIVSQKPVAGLYSETLQTSLVREGFEPKLFMTPVAKSSEAAKSQGVFLKLIKSMASSDGRGKSLFLIALGGGVVGDLTGFAAAVYRRGIPYIQIPTTLTAQVDSAIGGKSAIDLPQGKNLLGAIYQPRAVLSDIAVLDTLPERHWSDGFAEVIKYGIIRDARFFAMLEKEGQESIRSNSNTLLKLIRISAKIKAQVVSRDEYDKKDTRVILNFGHTAGHAIEAAAGYSGRLTHGEAIGIGMLIACDIARSMGVLKDPSLTARIENTLVKFGLPVSYKGLSPDAILRAMGFDKKAELGQNRFVLPVILGKTLVVKDVPPELVSEAVLKRRA